MDRYNSNRMSACPVKRATDLRPFALIKEENMKKEKMVCVIIIIVLPFAMTAGCSQNATGLVTIHNNPNGAYTNGADGLIEIFPETVPLFQPSDIFAIPMPVAKGESTVKNDIAEIDFSSTKDGYVMVRYLKKRSRELRVIIKSPSGTPYIYRLRSDGQYEVYPFSDGSGYYQITVYEHAFGNKYSAAIEAAQKIKLDDEFAPFIRPNQYVNYDGGSKTTQIAAEITGNAQNTTEKITVIYNFVTQNITYDRELAATIETGYIPDVDAVLEKGKGICFDYAAVMTAMLRSQGIPAKLVIGYIGNTYHAWISTYSNETGWVDGVIYFDGNGWKLMDPTLASYTGNKSELARYTQDENNYSAKYFY